jgi:hypothetical protein
LARLRVKIFFFVLIFFSGRRISNQTAFFFRQLAKNFTKQCHGEQRIGKHHCPLVVFTVDEFPGIARVSGVCFFIVSLISLCVAAPAPVAGFILCFTSCCITIEKKAKIREVHQQAK